MGVRHLLILPILGSVVGAASPLLGVCRDIINTNTNKPVMSWYNDMIKVMDNDHMKFLILLRAPKITSVRSNKTFSIYEKEIFPGNKSEGFQVEFSQWYKTWNISKIKRGPDSPEWVFYEGGGMLFNPKNGEEVVYVYPDEETCLVGKWDNGEMVGAREDGVEKILCGDDGIPVISLRGLTTNKNIFHYDPSTRTHLSDDPLVPDPMETKFVEVRKSELPGAGEGLFLLEDVVANEIIAFFNGLRVSIEDANKVAVHRESSHKIWNDWNDEDEMLDITPEYRSVESYRATLGHKINFSKQPTVEYDFIFHPRFGEIRSVRALRPLPAGTELTSMYGKVVDNYTFIKQVFKDYYTYTELDDEEKVDFLGEMKNNYEFMLKSMTNFDINTLYADKTEQN